MRRNESIFEKAAFEPCERLGKSVGHELEIFEHRRTNTRHSISGRTIDEVLFGNAESVRRSCAPVSTLDKIFRPGVGSSEASGKPRSSSSPNLGSSSPNLAISSPNLAGIRDPHGCLLTEQLKLPVVDDLDHLSPALRAGLESAAIEPRTKGKVSRDVLIGVVLVLCAGRFITLRCLAELVNRKPDALRDQYLSKLVRDRKLSVAFPTAPTHERQAYCTKESLPP